MDRFFRRDGRTERAEHYSRGRWRRRWPRSRAGGCLMWILIIIVVLIILSVMFGGFQKGSKAGGLGPVTATTVSVSIPDRDPELTLAGLPV